MQRLFVISITELDYEKKDLNIPFSDKRITIGLLSRIITNAIFLSHSLREMVTIRIFIEKPFSHLIQFDSATIRYLGPEMRSFSSLMLKARKKFLDAVSSDYFKKNIWFEAIPGFFLRLSNNPFEDFSIQSTPPHQLVYVYTEPKHIDSEVKEFTLLEFERLITKLSENKDAFILYYPLNQEYSLEIPISDNDFIVNKIAVSEKIDLARITNIVNIILDKNS